MSHPNCMRSLPKTILLNLVLPVFLGWAIYHFVARALECINPIEAVLYWLLAAACMATIFISIFHLKLKQIGSEILRRFACRFFPGSRYAKPPLSYTAARKFLAEKKYAEAIAAFQEILRHYPEEKEPYKQIIWIANLTGQTALAEKFSKKFT